MCLERSSQSLFAFNHKRDVAQLSLNSTRFWLRISMDRSLMTIRFVKFSVLPSCDLKQLHRQLANNK